MASVPPPYSSRDNAQVQPLPPASTIAATSPTQEFAETASVSIEWRITGLKSMYESTRGEQKSKCVKSAVFGDPDNLWEVLWYPNAGTSNQTAGDHVSLYLSCVPTAQERDSRLANQWTRKGLWWFKFEIRPLPPPSPSSSPHPPTSSPSTRPEPIATKDASDHTFAVKTANWGWQAFAKRDLLFQHPAVLAADGFVIVCTIQAQPQPPAGFWLGVGLQPGAGVGGASVGVNSPRGVGSGGGLSAWASEGGCGGVAGGTGAGGGAKRVVPREMVVAVGSMLDDPLYSDVEFIFPARRNAEGELLPQRNIYANKKLLNRCEYFEAMFNGGFKEVEGVIEDDDSEDELDVLSDSDVEDEDESAPTSPTSPNSAYPDRNTPTSHPASPSPRARTHSRVGSKEYPSGLATTASRGSSLHGQGGGGGSVVGSAVGQGHRHTTSDVPADLPQREEDDKPSQGSSSGDAVGFIPGGVPGNVLGPNVAGSKAEDEPEGEVEEKVHKEVESGGRDAAREREKERETPIGPKKTRVVIRDAAWSTWWALLYWIYTDIIFFAPLTSSFEHPKQRAPNSTNTSVDDPHTRLEWIHRWMAEHQVDPYPTNTPSRTHPSGDEDDLILGPRPVSAKSIYRLADKLDLPALKLRSFQHICSQLTSRNVPAEVFSRFASTYEDVRKVEVACFLKHWGEIKKSETMMQIWTQIRVGKHVGFEEVWPLIVGQLDFKPS
ncbi:hypothetical protein IAT38_006185 [Cryptococcus sp. DSM 104549]